MRVYPLWSSKVRRVKERLRLSYITTPLSFEGINMQGESKRGKAPLLKNPPLPLHYGEGDTGGEVVKALYIALAILLHSAV